MALPGTYLQGFFQLFDGNGDPLALGQVTFFDAGTSNLKDTFTTAQLTPGTENTNPVVLDSEGRATIFLQTGGYDVQVADSSAVVLYTISGLEDVGATFLGSLGTQLATGTTSVVPPYTVVETDLFVTVASTGTTGVVTLPPSADHPQPLTIKNLGTVALAVTPDGTETIDTVAAAFAVTAAASPTFPSIVLLPLPNGSGWYIQASHGL